MPSFNFGLQNNVLTIDQIETLINKNIDCAFNNVTNIPQTSLQQITDKAKLPLTVVYSDEVESQSLTEHSDIQFSGLLNGDILRYDGENEIWYNDNLVESGGTGDVTGGENIGASGIGVFSDKVSGSLRFFKLLSLTTGLTLTLDASIIKFSIVDGTTSAKGLLQLATDSESAAAKACNAADPRLTNSRTPTSHATSHKSGQSDVIKLDELGAPTDVTTLNASTSAHGLAPKLPNDASKYLDGTGAYTVPSSSTTSSYKVKNVTDQTINNTTTLTTVLSYSFAANEMGTDKIYEIILKGTYLNDSGTDRTMLVRITFGTTIMWEMTIGSFTDNSNRRGFDLIAEFQNKNVQNSQQLHGEIKMGDADAPTVGIGHAGDDEISTEEVIAGTSSETTNSTSKVFKIEVQHSTASSSITFTRTSSYIREKI